jgi:predicted PurR-regulated permease PerM
MNEERLSTMAFFATLFLLLYLTFILLRPLFAYIILAFIFAYIFNPLHSFLLRKTKKKNLSALAVTLLILLVLVLPTIALLFSLINQTTNAVQNFSALESSQYVDKASAFLTNTFNHTVNLNSYISTILTRVGNFIIQEKGPAFLSDIAGVVLGIFVMFYLMFFLFRGGKEFYAELKELVPLKRHHKIKLFAEIENMLHAVLYGQVITAIIQGGLLGLGLFVSGVPNAFFWTFVSIIICFIPFVGTPIMFIPAAIYLFLTGRVGAGIGLLIYGFVIVTNVDNVIKPRIIGKRANVHPLLVLLGVIGGLKVFGFIGLIIGPVILSLAVVFVRFYATDFLKKEELQSD